MSSRGGPAEPLLDARHVGARENRGTLDVVEANRVDERRMLHQGALHRSVLGEPAPDARANGVGRQRFDEAGQVPVARARSDESVQAHVVLDEFVDRGRGIHRGDLGLESRDLLGVGSLGSQPRRVRLEHPPHREEFEHRPVVVQIEAERDRLEQKHGVEARHVRPVATAHVDDPDDLECLHRLPEGVARQAEPIGEVLLRGEPVARTQLAADDHGLDLLDGVVGQGHPAMIGRTRPITGETVAPLASARVIDTHLHLWDPARLDYAWLEGERASRHGPEELRAAWAGEAMPAQFVFVQAECHPSQGIDEVEWISSLAGDVPVRGIVAHARLERGKRAIDTLDRLSANPLVVGVRRLLQSEAAGFARRREFLMGAALLAERGLTFDACARASGLDDVAALADAVPDLDIVLDHLGKPAVGSARRPMDPRGSAWERALVDLAQRPSVHVKLSGLPAESESAWTPEQIEPFLDVALDAFGPDRLVYGGDWPVSDPRHPSRWLEAVGGWALDRLGSRGRDAVLSGNAERFYFSARGRSRSPDTPPSTSSTTPVVDPDSGLTR